MSSSGASDPVLGQRSGRPRVSVITIFLNAERFIAEAIDSVLAQEFRDFELILVDDGSTQGCTAIAHDYARRYAPIVRCLEHEGHENRGMSASRNLGLSAARGEFVAFIDADDVWLPAKLAEQVAIMDANPGLGMVCGAARYWYSWDGGEDAIIRTGHIANAVIPPPEAAVALYPLGEAAAPCPSDLLLRRDVVTALGGFEEHFTGPRQLYEDQAFLGEALSGRSGLFLGPCLAQLPPARQILRCRSYPRWPLPRSTRILSELARTLSGRDASPG